MVANYTNVANVPDDWEIRYLKNLSAKPRLNGLYKKKEFYGRGIPMIHMTDIFAHDRIDSQKMECVELTDKEQEDFMLYKGDLVFARRSIKPEGAGDVSIIETDKPLTFESSIIRVRPKRENLDAEYAYYYLKSPYGHAQMMTLVRRVAVSGIAGSDLDRYQLPLPPMAEQIKIARIFSIWDKAIKAANKLVENSRAQNKALAQQLLTGKRRLPGFSTNKEVAHTSVGVLPKDWDVLPIGKAATEVSVRNADDEALPVLACSKHVGFVNSLEYFKKKVYSDDLTNYKVVRRGQFGFPSNHIEEGSIGLQDICDAGVVSPIYTVFEIDESRIDSGFLFKVLKTDHYRQRFAAATNASVDRRGSLRWSGFKAIRIPLPSLTEQQAIAAVLDHAAQLEEGYRQQREKLELEKCALMQQLLTGKRRVKLPPEHNTLAKEPAS